MERSFDFGALLKKHEKKHKMKPSQFVSVAGGIQKRFENNLQLRKSTRLTVFDRIRDLPRCESPSPLTNAQLKVEHRRQQLEKWKEQKEKKKKEAAAHKKKPFITGVPHAPLKFVPPPPPKPLPSTSGRVTRSQSARSSARQTKEPKPAANSFAPKNASFRPQMNMTNILHLVPAKAIKGKRKTANITFDPVIHDRSRTQKQAVTESNADRTTKSRITKPIPSTTRTTRDQNKGVALNTKRNAAKESNPSSYNGRTRQSVHTDMSDSQTSSEEMSSPLYGRTHRKSTQTEPYHSQSSEEKSQLTSSGTDVSLTKSNSSISPIVNRKTPQINKETTTSESSFENIPLKTSEVTSNRKSFSGTSSPMLRTRNTRKSLPKEPIITSESSLDSPNSESPSNKISQAKQKRKSLIKNTPKIVQESAAKCKTPRRSIQNNATYVTPKNSVPKSESSSEEKLRSPNSLSDGPRTPEQIIEEAKKCSPCVTMSRGKDNARREMKQKLAEGLLDDDASDADSVDHFRRQLASEITRITEMCDTWDKISEQTVLPESVQEALLGAVGQARLLMSQKLQQFATLIQRCARPEPGTSLVTPADLAGFWDMVFMQVENIDMRFKKLEELCARGWVDLPVEVKRKPALNKVNAKKPPAKPTGGPSRLREMIAAARKAKKGQSSTQQESAASPAKEPESGDTPPESKTFEAGFFCVRSPIKSPATPATPARSSLLKAVLSSEAKKASASKSSASFAMLRASVLGKNVECEGITLMPQTPKTPINFNATPGRSILKPSTTKKSTRKSAKKSIKVVLFDNADIQDIETDLEDRGKENTPRNSKLVRQDAVETSPVNRSPIMTRSRRKTIDVVSPRPQMKV